MSPDAGSIEAKRQAMRESIEQLEDDLGDIKQVIPAYCPRNRLTAANQAVDDIEVGLVKLRLAIRLSERAGS